MYHVLFSLSLSLFFSLSLSTRLNICIRETYLLLVGVIVLVYMMRVGLLLSLLIIIIHT